MRLHAASPLDQAAPDAFTHHLGLALNRALERRLGRVPSPARVNMAVDALLPPSPFVQHAIRVQEQLASLYEQLQKAQETQVRTEDGVKDTSPSSTRPPKRSVEPDSEPSVFSREIKRTRVESACQGSRPSSNSDNETKPGPQAPETSMSRKDAPITPRSLRPDHKSAEPPGADPARHQTTVIDSPDRLPITNTARSAFSSTASGPSRETGPALSFQWHRK
ncbi:hypothetical protein F5148DRAFT_695337 [Russula earlei]|uniref:Uncharacterized protein n=1 Tax=Russula earlei TaxID=71964 RepID=A0ACC0UFK3_9AGAM|nr:hypothetical protein F5148DRAFT_695337 [Russula earlei]